MNLWLSLVLAALQGVIVWVAGTLAVAAHAPGDSQEWHFQVLADGKPIGTHVFKVTERAGEQQIESTATFKVKALFLPLYRYRHHDHEIWKSGCLQQIDAKTDDNGRRSRVRGRDEPDGFRLESPGTGTTLPACVQTFAYWDREFLQQSRLLNPQTGEYSSVHIKDDGLEQLKFHGGRISAEHYTLITATFSVELWYTPGGQWLALESTTESGHRLRYEEQ